MNRRGSFFPTPAGGILLKALKRMGLGSALARQSIVNQWPKIVDRVIAKRAKAERLVDDILYVVVDSSVWMNELSANKFTLLEKINATLESGVPKIRDIKFTQSSWNRMKRRDLPVPEAPEIKSVPVDEKAIEVSTREIGKIKDLEVRAMLERIIRKDAQLKASSHHSRPE
ncbi:MAG: DUF721 domain-containing protein [Pseudomonadota bacterium]